MKQIYLTLSLLALLGFKSFGQTTLTEDANGVLNTGKVVAQTSVGQQFFVGHQLGTGYSFPAGGIFRAWTDNTNGTANYFYDGITGSAVMFSIRADGQGYFAGNMGIGTSAPGNKLDVQGGNADVYNTGAATSFLVGSSTTGKTYISMSTSADAGGYGVIQSIATVGSTYGNTVVNPAGGNVLIGQTTQGNAAYKLDIAGGVRANAITVNTTGADFVFEPTYHLFPLADLKKYLDQNHHLPEIPSAKEMQANGLNVGDNQIKLLQKVEELTLYMIEKDKQISEQQKQITDQQMQLNEQQNINQKQLAVNQAQQAQIDLLIKQVAALVKK